MIDRLPRREREVLDALYALGRGTAAEIRERLADPPSYSAVRAMLARLEAKGFVEHREDGQRYLYAPVVTRTRAQRTALQGVVRTFFGDSPARAATALLGMSPALSPEELDELEQAVARARKAAR